jgi:hypothetical protein
MELLSGIFSAFGLSASAGLNAYIPLLVISLLAKFTNLIKLTPPWDTLTDWWVIGLLTVLLLIEIFADKVPAVNHINDILQTFVRPVAGAIAFAASAGILTDIHPALALGAGLLVAGSVHAVKSVAVRPVVTATTGGAGNVPVSILEDIISTITSILAIVIPIIIGLTLLVIIIISVYLIRQRRQHLQTTPTT